LDAYQTYLPSIMGQVSQMGPGVAQGMGISAAASNPIYTASNLAQLGGMGGAYQQAGDALSQMQGKSTADLLAGSGGQAAREAAALNNELNPVQAATNKSAQDMLGAINLKGLSPGESNAVERGLNQQVGATGNLGLNNAMNTTSNAMNFGNAMNQKVGLMGNALGAASNVANSQNSQFNPVQTALGSGNLASNYGMSLFNPSQGNQFLTTPFSFGSSFGNQLVGIGSAANTKGGSSSSGGGLCFLTTACCEYRGLPDDCEELTVLRWFRDNIVPSEFVKEYYRIGPAIAERVKDNKEKLDYIYGVVTDCVEDIKSRRFHSALTRYVDMVQALR